MTIQELKKGISAGMIVTFMGKEVQVDLSSYYGHYFTDYGKSVNGRDFAPMIDGLFNGNYVRFDLETSGLQLKHSGKISWAHIENKKR